MSTVDAKMSIDLELDDLIANEIETDSQYIKLKTCCVKYCIENMDKIINENKKKDVNFKIEIVREGDFEGYFKINSVKKDLLEDGKEKLLDLENNFFNNI